MNRELGCYHQPAVVKYLNVYFIPHPDKKVTAVTAKKLISHLQRVAWADYRRRGQGWTGWASLRTERPVERRDRPAGSDLWPRCLHASLPSELGSRCPRCKHQTLLSTRFKSTPESKSLAQ